MITLDFIQALCNQLIEHKGKFVRAITPDGCSVAMWARGKCVYFDAVVNERHFEVGHLCPTPEDLNAKELQKAIVERAKCTYKNADDYAIAAKAFLETVS